MSEAKGKPRQSMQDKVVLRVMSRGLIPFILMFAMYTQAHGDFGPGGGFQAGVIFAAGLILYGLIFGLKEMQRAVPPWLIELLVAVGVMIYISMGVVTVFLGGSFLDYKALNPHHPPHGQELGLFMIELGVGITVSAVMTTIFYAFAGHDPKTEEG